VAVVELPGLSNLPIPPQFLAILALGLFAVIVIVFIAEVLDWLRQRSFLRELRKDPELFKRYVEARTQPPTQKSKISVPELIPKKVRVIVLREESQLEDICRYDGEFITCKRLGMQFVAPADYRPKPTYFRKKIMLTYYFDDRGNAIVVKPAGTEARAPDPRMADVIINKRLIQQIFSRLGANLGSIVLGIGIGSMIVTVVVFVLLPALGVPVTIGRQPVEVVHVHQYLATPPPGNYTVVPPPG